MLSEAVAALETGSLVIFPTDTVYGIAADPRVAGAKERLYEAKGRDRGKPIPILISGIAEAERRGAVLGKVARRLAQRFWPGPVTLVIRTGAAFEGFREPDHPLALDLLKRVGGALYVTSANRSGCRPVVSAKEARVTLAQYVRVVLCGGPEPKGVESTVVKVEDENVSLLREGAVPWAEIESCVRNC
jgi:L-threonylcarbamoyladenylate synthase